MFTLEDSRFAAVVQQAFDACLGKKDGKHWQRAVVRALQILRSPSPTR